MKNQNDRSFFRKLYIIIGLSSVIVVGLVYLISSGGTEKIQNHSRKTAEPSSEIAENTASPEYSPSASTTSDNVVTPSPSAEPVDITTDTSITRIVNRTHLISSSYVPSDLVVPDVPMNNTQFIRQEAAQSMKELFDAAGQAGYSLYLISGYRSYNAQSSLYYTYLAKYGQEYTSRLDAHPGASEHQLGLAADFGTTDHACELQTCFADSGASQWLKDNAWKYGWILRYPEGKETVTGIMYSPWNYRYVGTKEAEKIYQSGKTMEEYYGLNG